jgi:hypothetical protein
MLKGVLGLDEGEPAELGGEPVGCGVLGDVVGAGVLDWLTTATAWDAPPGRTVRTVSTAKTTAATTAATKKTRRRQ